MHIILATSVYPKSLEVKLTLETNKKCSIVSKIMGKTVGHELFLQVKRHTYGTCIHSDAGTSSQSVTASGSNMKTSWENKTFNTTNSRDFDNITHSCK